MTEPIITRAHDALQAGLTAAEAQPTLASAIAAFIERLPAEKGEYFHNVLMTPESLASIASIIRGFDSGDCNQRPVKSPNPRNKFQLRYE